MTKPYKFKTRRPAAGEVEGAITPKLEEARDEEERGFIGTVQADSKEEWWTAQWLWQNKLDFEYQYFVFGSQPKYFYKIDFLVHTVPLKTIVEINGDHWHEGELGDDDRKRQVEIEAAMRDIAKIPMTILYADDLESRETLEAALERTFNNA